MSQGVPSMAQLKDFRKIKVHTALQRPDMIAWEKLKRTDLKTEVMTITIPLEIDEISPKQFLGDLSKHRL